MKREHLLTAVLLVMTAAALSGQTRPKRFLTAPLTIEDQGSFIVGGVQKFTDGASVAPPVPGTAPAPVTLHQIMIGQMEVQFQVPRSKVPRLAGDRGARIAAHGRVSRVFA